MKAVTSLKVKESMFNDYDDLLRFLRSAPLLLELALQADAWLGDDEPQLNTSLSIPSLLTLEILEMPDEEDSADHLCYLSKALLTPSLRHLKLGTVPWPSLGPFAKRLNDGANVNDLQYPELGWLEIGMEELDTETLENLIYGLPNVTRVTLWAENDNDGTVLILLCDETAWPHLDVLTVETFDEHNEGFMAILCHVIASRTSIGCLRLRTTIWEGEDPPSDESDESIMNYDGNLSYGIKWLQSHVHLEYRNVCDECNVEWDHSNYAWAHECEVE
jgi:hypothetical protein